MSRTAIIRILDAFAIFLVAHLVFYVFTGLALWGVNIDEGRGVVLIMLHVVGVFAPCIARDFR